MDLKVQALKKVYVHRGRFNLDDVVSAALIKAINPEVTIIRDNKAMPSEGEIRLGGKGEYGYESRSKAIDPWGNLYTLSAIVYENCAEELFQKAGIVNREEAKELFYDRFIGGISSITRGGRHGHGGFLWENKIILAMNAYWYEGMTGTTDSDKQFDMALEAMSIILENWLRRTKEDVDATEAEDEIWDRAEKESSDGIYVLERHIPWQYQVKRNPETKAKIIIFKSDREEGKYNLVSKSTDEVRIKDNEYLTFRHPSGFMGVADSLDHAILAAKLSIGGAQMVS